MDDGAMAGLLLRGQHRPGARGQESGAPARAQLNLLCDPGSLLFSLAYSVPAQRTTSPASRGAPNRILESSPGSRLGCHLVASGGMAPGLESGLGAETSQRTLSSSPKPGPVTLGDLLVRCVSLSACRPFGVEVSKTWLLTGSWFLYL